jgi:hypothetical protein
VTLTRAVQAEVEAHVAEYGWASVWATPGVPLALLEGVAWSDPALWRTGQGEGAEGDDEEGENDA